MPLGMIVRACCLHKYVEIDEILWSNELQQQRMIKEVSSEWYEVKGKWYKLKD